MVNNNLGYNNIVSAHFNVSLDFSYSGINVPRSRFLPVKKCSDLLLVMSNLYIMEHGCLMMSPQRQFPSVPIVQLSGKHFNKVLTSFSQSKCFKQNVKIWRQFWSPLLPLWLHFHNNGLNSVCPGTENLKITDCTQKRAQHLVSMPIYGQPIL